VLSIKALAVKLWLLVKSETFSFGLKTFGLSLKTFGLGLKTFGLSKPTGYLPPFCRHFAAILPTNCRLIAD
jgi:hypothetical protein